MNFLYPSTLFILLGLPVLIFFQLREYRLNQHDLIKMSNVGEYEHLRPVFFIKWFISSICIILAYILFVLSLSGLSWGEQAVREDRLGIDIIYLVDVSYSMLAEDVKPNRLARAREIVRRLSEMLTSARIGIVAFKGGGVVLLPLTEDIIALENTLLFLNTEVISTPGSNLEAALYTAITSFPSGSNRHKIIVLLSDGEFLRGNINKPVQLAVQQGISIFTYGIGNRRGTHIILDNKPVKKNDKVVITKLNSTALEEISRLTGSSYFENPSGVSLLDNEIKKIASRREEGGFRMVNIERYRIALALAVIAYIFHILISLIKIREIF